jgi:hypothetical protein
MGNFLLRTTPNSEVFVVWSSIVDSPLFAGTRTEIEDYLIDEAVQRARIQIRNDLKIATETGSSVALKLPGQPAPTGSWNDDGIQYGARKWLPRKQLGKFIALWMDEKYDSAKKLLEDLDFSD